MVFRLAAVGAVVVGWSAAVLNQFRSASLVQAHALVLLPQGMLALVVLAVVGLVAVGVVLLVQRRLWGPSWAPVEPQSIVLLLAALSCGYLAIHPLTAAAADDYAGQVGLPLSLMLPTARRSLLTAAALMLLAGLAPWGVVRVVLLAFGGLALLTLSTPSGFTDWLAPFPLTLVVATLVLELRPGRQTPTASSRTADGRASADN